MNKFKQLFKDHKQSVKNLGITLNAPCKDKDLADLESKLNCTLPPDLIDFYTFCNGFETYDFLFRVIPLAEAVDYRSELKGNTFHFAEYMIYSD